MSRVLSELLGASEPNFTATLHELESASGIKGIDIKVQLKVADIVRQKMRELGLDPDDTKPAELYYSLQALTAKHDKFLMKAIGAKNNASAAQVLSRIKSTVEELPFNRQCWAIKHSVAKRLLKSHPPQRTMKKLGYKSVDSFLKRENITEIFIAIKFIETAKWDNGLSSSIKSLRPSDFENRTIDIIIFKPKRWGELVADNKFFRHSLDYSPLLGAVGLVPNSENRTEGMAIALLPLTLYCINEIRLFSSSVKLDQVKSDFSEILVKELNNKGQISAKIAKQPISWRIIREYFSKLGKSNHPEIFEPHLQHEDIKVQKAEDVIYRIEPALKFWEGLDYVAAPSKRQPISFNLLDNAISYYNSLDYGQQSVTNFRNSLWKELLLEYISQPEHHQQILDQLDGSLVNPSLTLVEV